MNGEAVATKISVGLSLADLTSEIMKWMTIALLTMKKMTMMKTLLDLISMIGVWK